MPRVLLVEPDKQLALTIAKYLRKAGLETRIANNAQEAVSKADEESPDIVILELAMPKNNGVAFLQEFKTYTDWTNIPILIYSRLPREDTGLTLPEWHKQGVDAYLYKSTHSLASLTDTIRDKLNAYEIS